MEEIESSHRNLAARGSGEVYGFAAESPRMTFQAFRLLADSPTLFPGPGTSAPATVTILMAVAVRPEVRVSVMVTVIG